MDSNSITELSSFTLGLGLLGSSVSQYFILTTQYLSYIAHTRLMLCILKSKYVK